MEGFIYLHRSLLDWEWKDDLVTLKVFIWCLLKANFTDKYWQGHLIKRGSFITSLKHFSNELNISEMQLRTSIKKLKKSKCITSNATNKNTILTICNYDTYQNNKMTEQQAKERTDNKQITDKQQTDNKQITTTNNDNKENNDNNENNINEDFEKIRVLYRKYKSLRGYQTEYDNFVKKHKDYKQAIEFMISNIGLLEQYLKDKGKYVKDFATFINNRDWELLQGMIDKEKQNRLELEELKRKNNEEAFAPVKDCREPELVEYWKKQAEKGSEFLRLIGAE